MPSPSPRRFPPLWTVLEVTEALCIVDGTDRPVAYVCFDTAERGANTERMTKDVARRIARLRMIRAGSAQKNFGRLSTKPTANSGKAKTRRPGKKLIELGGS